MTREEKLALIKSRFEPKIINKTQAKLKADQELIDVEFEYQQKVIAVNEYFDALTKLQELQKVVDKGEPT